jgi:hypothetical protein
VYWPGGAYVDWVGTDFYGSYPNFALLSHFYTTYRDKPFVLSEWALYGADDPGFVRATFSWVESHPRVRMLSYYQGFSRVRRGYAFRSSTSASRCEVGSPPGMRVRSFFAAAIASCTVLGTAASDAFASTQTAHLGNVTATFTFHGTFPTISGQRLKIVRAGKVAYGAPVVSPKCGTGCALGGTPQGASSVHVLRLEPGAEPDVVLDLYTGGAHCCWLEQVFYFDPVANTYRKVEHDFGNGGDEIKPIGPGGRLEFVGADDRFAYLFTSFAASGLPIRILDFGQHHFNDVTRAHPALIKRDAARWLSAFRHHYADGEGLIAAWAADEDLLGHMRLVASTLATEQHAGHLNGPIESGAKFVAALERKLRQFGYAH